ncbi:MAG TPA: hypothetical protein VGL15_02105 [Vicinamibacteria bacterium]
MYAPEVQDHLSRFAKRDQTMISDTVPRQLAHQPAVPTRNRKPLDANPIAPWELRIGGYRVYFEVNESAHSVRIVAVGLKDRDRVLIGEVKRRGKPVLGLTPVTGDWESAVVANNPAFLAIVGRSRASLDAGKGILTAELRRRLGLKPRKARDSRDA